MNTIAAGQKCSGKTVSRTVPLGQLGNVGGRRDCRNCWFGDRDFEIPCKGGPEPFCGKKLRGAIIGEAECEATGERSGEAVMEPVRDDGCECRW